MQGDSICIHDRVKYFCKECKGSQVCPHDKIKSVCLECQGGSFCEHGKKKTFCRDCGGAAFCAHNIIKYHCKACKGSEICVHNKHKRQCKDCGGGSFCIHNVKVNYCKQCNGSSVCEHNRIRSVCKECKGSQICEHGKIRYQCRECGGKRFCIHGKDRSYCKDCGGSRLCKSRHDPYNTGCRTQSNRKLNGFCTHCFANLFPNDPKTLTIRKKSKELQVVSHIASKYDGFVHDKPFYVDLQGGCCETKRRIDLRKLICFTMLCVEVDEDQHKSYIKGDEDIRYDDLFMDFAVKYIFIRYNPDKFKDKYNKVKNPLFDTRMQVLENAIDKHTQRIHHDENQSFVEIHHVFYDEI